MTDLAGPVLRPLAVSVPPRSVVFAESVHGTGFRMGERRDPFGKIIYVVRGSIALEREDAATLQGGEGTFFAVDEGELHRIRDLSPSTLLLLCLGRGFLEASRDRVSLWDRLHGANNGAVVRRTRAGSQSGFESLWRVALFEQNTAALGHALQIRCCADQILVQLARLRRTRRDAGASIRVAEVLREMERSFHDPWDIDAAAARAALSRHYFTKLFRRAAGESFLARLTSLRLEHAASLLERGGHSVAGVAFACGFGDLSHFYRVFKTRFGRPPGQWLQAHARRKPSTAKRQKTGAPRQNHPPRSTSLTH
jgi:AraC-like DNA-binding protein